MKKFDLIIFNQTFSLFPIFTKQEATTSGSGLKIQDKREKVQKDIKCISLEGATFKEIQVMSKRFRKLSHTIYECKYHLIFCPKYRYRILKDEIREYVRRQIERLLSQKEGVEIIEMNVQLDHVHLVVWIPPKYAVSNVMGYLKGKLAIKLLNRDAQLGRKYWGRHLWSRGYCVSTVGLDETRIREYVRWQEKKQKEIEQQQGTLFDEGE